MSGYIKITSSPGYIEQEINKIIVSEMDSVLRRVRDLVETDIKDNIKPLFETSETYLEMTTALSKLNVEIGIPSDEAKARWLEIFNLLVEQITVSYEKIRITGSSIDGGLIIDIIEDDFTKIVKSSFANFTTEKGENLPWLEWLMLDGDKPVILTHKVKFVNPNKKSKYFTSRTGGAIMVKNGEWNVPNPFTGVSTDNWLTRVIQSEFIFIVNFTNESIKRHIESLL